MKTVKTITLRDFYKAQIGRIKKTIANPNLTDEEKARLGCTISAQLEYEDLLDNTPSEKLDQEI